MDYMRLLSGITNTLEITEKVLPLIKNSKEPLSKLINIMTKVKPKKSIKKDSPKTITSNNNSTLSFFQ